MNEIWMTWFNYTKKYIIETYGEDEWENIMTICGDPLADIHFANLRSEKK